LAVRIFSAGGNVNTPLFFDEIALLALLAGVLAVDERAGWQGLFSQPVVSSAIVGLCFGNFLTGVSVGIVLELVWLSVLPMRGTRRPDAVAGAIVGAGAACIVARHTGDPRFVFLVAIGAFLGLIVGEFAGSLGRRIYRFRDRELGRFEPPANSRSLSRRLLWYSIFSLGFIVAAEFVLVVVILPLAVLLTDSLTGYAGAPFVTGSRWWVNIVPVLGAGALIHTYWHKQHNRYLILCAAVTLMLLWIK